MNERRIKMTTMAGNERFQNGAQDYVAYLETPEGRLRADLAFAHLEDFLPRSQAEKSLCALDVGCGTGATAVRLARLGMRVALLDSSPVMLDIAKRTALEAGVADKIIWQIGVATRLTNLVQTRSLDVILCHNVLEYLDDPIAVLRGAARALRDSSAILSVLVRNRAGEVLKAAIQTGDLAVAENNLTAERGVRVLADYLPSRISRSADYDRIFELERKLSSRPEYAAIARYTQCFARLL